MKQITDTGQFSTGPSKLFEFPEIVSVGREFPLVGRSLSRPSPIPCNVSGVSAVSVSRVYRYWYSSGDSRKNTNNGTPDVSSRVHLLDYSS